MPILPSGRKRIMEAQYPQDMPQDEWGVDELGPSSEYPMEETPSMPEQQEIREEGTADEDPDLMKYIFDKLETFDYPPRRLEEFSEEFIEEEIYPDGFKEIKVTVPDKYFGTKKRLTDQDLQTIVNEIMDGFNLALTKATRKEKKIIMEFTSQAKVKEDEQAKMQEGVPTDDLDEIFGTKGTKGPKKKERKAAQTLQEMINEEREKTLVCLERFISNGET